jgi:hypothetical protein
MDDEWLTCWDCGEKKEDVMERNCPYEEDVMGKEKLVTICDDCCTERADDI